MTAHRCPELNGIKSERTRGREKGRKQRGPAHSRSRTGVQVSRPRASPVRKDPAPPFTRATKNATKTCHSPGDAGDRARPPRSNALKNTLRNPGDRLLITLINLHALYGYGEVPKRGNGRGEPGTKRRTPPLEETTRGHIRPLPGQLWSSHHQGPH